jgi:hypothetical protein
LVTARADKIQDEHSLLDLALDTLLRAKTLRVELSPEDAVHPEVPISLLIADTDPTGLWTSLGMPARAGFVATVTAPMPGNEGGSAVTGQHDAADGSQRGAEELSPL